MYHRSMIPDQSGSPLNTLRGRDIKDAPSIVWWVLSAEPERDAVLFGDHITNVPGDALLVVTTHRLGVVVKKKQLEEAEPEGPAAGGFFGRAKAVVHQVQRAAEGISASENGPVSYVEAPLARIAGMHAVRLGRRFWDLQRAESRLRQLA